MSVSYRKAERNQLAGTLNLQVDRDIARRKVELGNALNPACQFEPCLPGTVLPTHEQFRLSRASTRRLPDNDTDIAFASLAELGAWLRKGVLTSARLTGIYLSRLKKYDGKLEAVVTLTEKLAMKQARRADRELRAGKVRGPLHGIPWGAKDLLDTKGITTTWGAGPYADRVPKTDAKAVTLLEEAGAVLIAKLSLGALAFGEVWHDGKTRNPWNLNEGSSGSSAGSGATVAAGCVGFAIGSETLGSIISPADRCGTVGLRPTFGRVPRTGAMALCWSLDKLGPLTRTAEDAAMVLHALDRFDAADPGSRDVPLDFDAREDVTGMVVGYDPAWLASQADQDALKALKRVGCRLKKITLPDLPYDSLETILFVEAAAAFEELTLSGRDRELPEQLDHSWPNEFRQARLISAVELIQADRLRRRVMDAMAEVMGKVDVLLAPQEGNPLLTITNCTGHPAIAVPTGFAWRDDEAYGPAAKPGPGSKLLPHCSVLWGRLYDDGRMIRLAMALEAAMNLRVAMRPPLFDH
ncbi:MAG: amidase [Rhodospirillaceae bacterium]|nr:amidase [Rhodospirillaceae bacterium]MBT7648049.1 amidase [Rhodospirillaceae bacterium]